MLLKHYQRVNFWLNLLLTVLVYAKICILSPYIELTLLNAPIEGIFQTRAVRGAMVLASWLSGFHHLPRRSATFDMCVASGNLRDFVGTKLEDRRHVQCFSRLGIGT